MEALLTSYPLLSNIMHGFLYYETVKCEGLWNFNAWVEIPTLPLCSQVTQLPAPHPENDHRSYLKGLLYG